MKCPVCWQTVQPNVGGYHIDRHRNSIGQPCKGAGLPIRVCEDEL